jgi:hypothetical protein
VQPSVTRIHLDQGFACWESEHLFGVDLYLGSTHGTSLVPLHQFAMTRRPTNEEWKLAHRWVTARMADNFGITHVILADLSESVYIA